MKLETYRGAVLTSECDSNNHMNVMYYINKFELAGRQISGRTGMTRAFMEENNLGIVVLEQQFQYKQEVFEDDILHIETEIIGLSNKVITMKHEMMHSISNQVVAEAIIKLVVMNKIGRKAVPIPAFHKEKLEALMRE